jgi:predicted AAA+ superfamily ATPase
VPEVEPQNEILPRRAWPALRDALSDTRVVLVNGARQCGKSTIVSQAAVSVGASWRTLDDRETLQAARADPIGFVDADVPLVIDEVQRAPELFLAIKAKVDVDQRPGRFLLTGSSHVLGMHGLSDALVGRMETIELWPFSQGEIDASPDGFVDAAFTMGTALALGSAVPRRAYAERVTRGGFPVAVLRQDEGRRRRFLDAYLRDLVTRDVSLLGEIERLNDLRALFRLVAARSGGQLVVNSLASDLRVAHRTANRYLGLLEEVFAIRRIPAWSRNLSTRATGTPKVALVDSGLAAALVGADAESLLRPGSPAYGGLLEGFVLMELARQLTWSRTQADLYHYRTRTGVEVDAVLESRQGKVVGIEVKASSTVRSEDFRGLRHLAERLGDDFVVGIVLYTGPQALSFGPKMRLLPVSALWTSSADG